MTIDPKMSNEVEFTATFKVDRHGVVVFVGNKRFELSGKLLSKLIAPIGKICGKQLLLK